LSARSSRDAVEAFLTPLQRAVSCVSPGVLVERRGPARAAGPRFAVLSDALARLRGTSSLSLTILHAFEVEALPEDRASWRARTVGYAYEVLRAEGQTLLAYHWHSVGASPVTTPHLHLGGTLAGIDLSKAHLPTGHVALQDVLRFAIIDLGVEPLRDDWDAILAGSWPRDV